MDWLFGSKKENLQKKYEKKMQEAMEAQRNGNIDLFSSLSSEAEELILEIEKL